MISVNTFGSTDDVNSLPRTEIKKSDKTENKKATTWFLVRPEKNVDIEIKAALKNISPRYPTIISGRYRFETNDKENGSPKVSTKPIAVSVKMEKNFAITISVSETGSVKSTSMVLLLFSSDITLIVKAGIKTKNNHGIRLKKDFIEALPTANRSFTKRKLAKTANKIITI